MADSFIQLPPDSTGKLVDTSSLTVGLNTVQRERDNISDPTDAAGLARVENTTPAATDYGLVVRVTAEGLIGATPPLSAIQIGGVELVTGKFKPLSIDNETGALATIPIIAGNGNVVGNNTATWNSATAVNAVVLAPGLSAGAVFALVLDAGSVSGGTVVVESSADGVTWLGQQFLDQLTGAVLTSYNFVAGTSKQFYVSGNSQQYRVRLSVAISGSVTVALQASNMPVAAQGIVSIGNFPTTPTPTPAPVPGNSGVVAPILVKTDPTTNDLLRLLIMETRAVRRVLSHLASEDGTMRYDDFNPELITAPADEIIV